MRRFVSFGPAIVVITAAMLVLALAPVAVRNAQLAGISASVRLAQARLDDGSSLLEQINQATRDIATAVLPGVVHIRVSSRSESEDGARRFGVQRASAAGWFYNTDGFVVTNAHVVDGATSIRVELYDGRVRLATLVAKDERTDIAVLRVPGITNSVPLRRATGEPISIGDTVFAFGSPFGVKFSMSRGIVSGLGRSEAASLVGMRTGYTNFIQTDAAMNPGNSGGPLVDVRGRVLGMSTAIANNVEFSFNDRAPQGQSAGIGFAVPIDTIEAVVSQLIESNIVVRGHLGIGLADYPQRADLRDGGPYDGAGARILMVREGGPAAKAGLRDGDIVIRVLGQPCMNSDVLRSLVSIRPPGSVIPMTVWRSGETIDLNVRIGAAYFGLVPSESDPNQMTEDLIYVPGSETMTLEQVRERLRGLAGEKRID